jgi:hypothetical protein
MLALARALGFEQSPGAEPGRLRIRRVLQASPSC